MTVEQLENGAERFVTAGGVAITRQRHDVPYAGAIEAYVDGLDSRRGAVFSSNYEYPGRYTRWDTAIIDPPLVILVAIPISPVTDSSITRVSPDVLYANTSPE